MQYVERDRGYQTPCYEYVGRIDKRKGYGKPRINGKEWRAHRLAWVLANGPLPSSLFVCHHCDNPPCIRLDHLFLGDNTDNVYDAIGKGRWGHVKLTPVAVAEIMRLRSGGLSPRRIAEGLGLNKSTVADVAYGRRWKRFTAGHETVR